MKRLIFIVFLLGYFTSSARAEDDGGMLEQIIKDAMINTAKGPGIDYAIKQLRGDVAKLARSAANLYAVAQDIDALMKSKTDQDRLVNGMILGARVYDLYISTADPGAEVPYIKYAMLVKNIIDYGKAESEREKYFAALSTGATIASFFPFGWIAAFGVLQQQINDGYVIKHYMQKVEGWLEGNNHLRTKVKEQLVERANSEVAYFRTVLTEVRLRLEAAQAMSDRLLVDCVFEDPEKIFANVHNCNQDSQDVHYLTSVAGELLKSLLATRFEIVTVEEMEKLMKQDPGYLQGWETKINTAVEDASKKHKENEASLRTMVAKLNDAILLEKHKAAIDRLSCLRATDREVTPVLARLKTAEAPEAFERAMLKGQLVAAKHVFERKCRGLKEIPVRTKAFLLDLERDLKEWNERVF